MYSTCMWNGSIRWLQPLSHKLEICDINTNISMESGAMQVLRCKIYIFRQRSRQRELHSVGLLSTWRMSPSTPEVLAHFSSKININLEVVNRKKSISTRVAFQDAIDIITSLWSYMVDLTSLLASIGMIPTNHSNFTWNLPSHHGEHVYGSNQRLKFHFQTIPSTSCTDVS